MSLVKMAMEVQQRGRSTVEGGDSQQVRVKWELGLQLVNSTYGVSAWRTIRNLWHDLSRNIVYKVGNGDENPITERKLEWK
ncbi:hypothetical protein H5410_028889 [Solanum commersonii]|uniref:Uncharacterized protein n=1 Tax=Solanum commersonii TaxID=4109 RepID=A0A9J5Z5A0_SOLCO|nr:hypothetical protein H5410_028889 [Solanum commersonii]